MPLFFHNTYICTLIRLNLKETVLWIGVLLHDLHWENKSYKLKSSISLVSNRKFIREHLPEKLFFFLQQVKFLSMKTKSVIILKKIFVLFYSFLPTICDTKFNSAVYLKNFLVNFVLLET